MFDATKGGDPKIFDGVVGMPRAMEKAKTQVFEMRRQYVKHARLRWVGWTLMWAVITTIFMVGLFALGELFRDLGWAPTQHMPLVWMIGLGAVFGALIGATKNPHSWRFK